MLDFPIPSLGRPLLRPSNKTQALQTDWLDTKPHLVHVPLVGNFIPSLIDNFSPTKKIQELIKLYSKLITGCHNKINLLVDQILGATT